MDLTGWIALAGELVALIGTIVGVFVSISKVANGQKCLLRTDMLKIYYNNREKQEIRQYEYENFILLYEAYKTLKGNSFIDKIYEEVHSWEIIN
jgi:hypothetical protein